MEGSRSYILGQKYVGILASFSPSFPSMVIFEADKNAALTRENLTTQVLWPYLVLSKTVTANYNWSRNGICPIGHSDIAEPQTGLKFVQT